jgi:hypothetical protein
MIDLSPWIDHCRLYSDSVEALKCRYTSTRNLRTAPHFLGKLGECLFCQWAGVPIDWTVHPEGDGGADFRINGWRIDIKATAYWRYPELKEFPRPRHRPHVYVLAAINLEEGQGRLAGYISAHRLMAIPPRPYHGLGQRIVAPESTLFQDWKQLHHYLNRHVPMEKLRPVQPHQGPEAAPQWANG